MAPTSLLAVRLRSYFSHVPLSFYYFLSRRSSIAHTVFSYAIVMQVPTITIAIKQRFPNGWSSKMQDTVWRRSPTQPIVIHLLLTMHGCRPSFAVICCVLRNDQHYRFSDLRFYSFEGSGFTALRGLAKRLRTLETGYRTRWAIFRIIGHLYNLLMDTKGAG